MSIFNISVNRWKPCKFYPYQKLVNFFLFHNDSIAFISAMVCLCKKRLGKISLGGGLLNNIHLMYGPGGNSWFCFPESPDESPSFSGRS